MEKKQFVKALEEAKKASKKRNFSQSYDLIINLKDYDIKRTESHVDFFALLPKNTGKKKKICGLIGPELKPQSEKVFDKTITQDDFSKFTVKKDIKKLATEYDFFVAQANIMPLIAKTFGRVFGPKQKMPNPKAGCVVPPNANLQQINDKLQNTIRLAAKTETCIKCRVGVESMNDEDIIENLMSVYNQVIHHLPNEENQIKNVFLKTTMGKPVEVK